MEELMNNEINNEKPKKIEKNILDNFRNNEDKDIDIDEYKLYITNALCKKKEKIIGKKIESFIGSIDDTNLTKSFEERINNYVIKNGDKNNQLNVSDSLCNLGESFI